ncbi:MAG: hypothetical protein MK188_01470 [Gammaproteobacteria bacterium]|nr:hypothetical protein [Gammaproteobacteria bacterium]
MKFKSMILMAFLVLSHGLASARDHADQTTKNTDQAFQKKVSKGTNIQSLQAKVMSIRVNSRQSKKPVLYSTSWCWYCNDARDFLIEHDIEFDDFDVEKDKEAAARYKKSGGEVVPFLVFGDKTIKGFTATAYHQFFDISVH